MAGRADIPHTRGRDERVKGNPILSHSRCGADVGAASRADRCSEGLRPAARSGRGGPFFCGAGIVSERVNDLLGRDAQATSYFASGRFGTFALRPRTVIVSLGVKSARSSVALAISSARLETSKRVCSARM